MGAISGRQESDGGLGEDGSSDDCSGIQHE